MKNTDFWIRDPFVLLDGGKYYIYGTTRPRESHGFDVYTSDDLENFQGPFEVFDYFDGFWGKMHYWAPEVHKYNGKYYMFATFKDDGAWHGCQILSSDSPMGPFVPHSEGPITPKEWSSLDGTFYVDKNGKPYMIFCHEWIQTKNGEMCYAELSEDLTHFVSEPKLMFRAGDFPEIIKACREADEFVTDGPFMYRNSKGDLIMIWSSIGERGYLECQMRSSNGEIDGKFESVSLLFEEDGGHGMIFQDKSGSLKFSLHHPNRLTEHLELFDIYEDESGLLRRK
ncbi:MAG: family 43 glycosylhydrolase [Clostridia bacterium]|nr:family 43 glycosylhydrolase [Clostridia bacterium]